MKYKLLVATLLCLPLTTFAGPFSENLIYKEGTKEISLEEALANVKPGSVILLGEQHNSLEQAEQQMQVLKMLRKNGLSVSVGMEFFDYLVQSKVDAYTSSLMSENDFLKAVDWGGFSFDAYRQQVLFPQMEDGKVVALNAPRSLTGRIAKVGVAGLTAEEKALMPPQWSLGNSDYFERFSLTMGGHANPQSLQRYFEAQSTWDETMAWVAENFVSQNPQAVLVIIVGEFHVQYGGGLPDRLKAKGIFPLTFSLVNLNSLSPSEVQSEIEPHSKYGSRADFVWTSNFSRP